MWYGCCGDTIQDESKILWFFEYVGYTIFLTCMVSNNFPIYVDIEKRLDFGTFIKCSIVPTI